jgi:hypothetical protein
MVAFSKRINLAWDGGMDCKDLTGSLSLVDKLNSERLTILQSWDLIVGANM